MKFTILAAVLLPLTSMAQFSKGDKLVGGRFFLTTQRAPESPNGSLTSKYTDFWIQPTVGLFLSDQFVLGANIGYGLQKSETIISPTLTSKSDSYSITVGLLIRRYFKINDNFFMFIDGNPNYVKSSSDNSSSSKTHTYSIGLSARPVFTFLPSPRWGVELGIGNISFQHMKNTTTDRKVDNFNLNYGSLNFGLTYYLRKSTE